MFFQPVFWRQSTPHIVPSRLPTSPPWPGSSSSPPGRTTSLAPPDYPTQPQTPCSNTPVLLGTLLPRSTPPTLSRTGAAQAALCSYRATLPCFSLPPPHPPSSTTPSAAHRMPSPSPRPLQPPQASSIDGLWHCWAACINAKLTSLRRPQQLLAMTLETANCAPRRKRKSGTPRPRPVPRPPTMHDLSVPAASTRPQKRLARASLSLS
jgi:hypothetical protein